MRLRMSRAVAEETLTRLVNEGYQTLSWIRTDYHQRRAAGTFDSVRVPQAHADAFNSWGGRVIEALRSIFPTGLEASYFRNAPQAPAPGLLSGDDDTYKHTSLILRLQDFIRVADEIMQNHLGRYTDLPLHSRLYIEDIDSFSKVRDVNPAMVAHLLSEKGYLDCAEDPVQRAFEQILNEPFQRRGNTNDISARHTWHVAEARS